MLQSVTLLAENTSDKSQAAAKGHLNKAELKHCLIQQKKLTIWQAWLQSEMKKLEQGELQIKSHKQQEADYRLRADLTDPMRTHEYNEQVSKRAHKKREHNSHKLALNGASERYNALQAKYSAECSDKTYDDADLAQVQSEVELTVVPSKPWRSNNLKSV